MIEDLQIKNFRAFSNFQISNLARVNLIAGKNNVGKSTLLDACYLLMNQYDTHALYEIVKRRKEFSIVSKDVAYNINHFFQGHSPKSNDQINISTVNSKLLFNLAFIKGDVNYFETVPYEKSKRMRAESPYRLEIKYDLDQKPHSMYLEDYGVLRIPWTINEGAITFNPKHPLRYIGTNGLDVKVLREIWDRINLTPAEADVIDMLKVLDPEVERIKFLTSAHGIEIKYGQYELPIPLGSMGEGMNRILGIAMSMASLKDGYLLIDEIDTGLHYRSMTDMWKLAIITANRLNVQIFATTHSQDCINSFSEALEELEDCESGAYFRLQRRGDKIQAKKYDAKKLSRALNNGVEVR